MKNRKILDEVTNRAKATPRSEIPIERKVLQSQGIHTVKCDMVLWKRLQKKKAVDNIFRVWQFYWRLSAVDRETTEAQKRTTSRTRRFPAGGKDQKVQDGIRVTLHGGRETCCNQSRRGTSFKGQDGNGESQWVRRLDCEGNDPADGASGKSI